MKYFFALPALLRPAVLLATASQHSFSVSDDLLAYPQFEVIFPEEDYILEVEAEERLKSHIIHKKRSSRKNNGDASHQADIDQYQAPTTNGEQSNDGTNSARTEENEHDVIYEYMLLEDHRYLCAIPQIAKPDPLDAEAQANATLSKAEVQKELIRATDHGWEILEELNGQCVFYYGGWWSYRFCYGQSIKQFHQLPQTKGMPAFPPVEDPSVPGFELGVYKGKEPEAKLFDDDEPSVEETGVETATKPKKPSTGSGGLVQRGDSTYLVQRLDGGTKCDLTGKPRKIEVQFHCNPDVGDRITEIKETATCTYRMVVQTSRLCKDVAFHPPVKDAPNAVSCARVLAEDQLPEYEKLLEDYQQQKKQTEMWEATAKAAEELGVEDEAYTLPPKPVVIGDTEVGGRKLVPKGHTLEKSVIVGGGKEKFVETVASSSGLLASDADMKRLGLTNKDAFNKLRTELEKVAQGQEWKVDIVDTPRGRELRGIFGTKDDEESPDSTGEGEKGDGEKKTAGKKADKKKTTVDETKDKVKGKAKATEQAKKTGTNAGSKQQEKADKPSKQKAKQLKPKKVSEEQEKNEKASEGSEEEFFGHEEL